MTATSHNASFLLTPPGTGAIGVIRVTGPEVLSIVGQVFESESGVPLSPRDEGRLRYGKFIDDGEVVDDVVASLTNVCGSWEVDITAHGGVRVVERVLLTLDRLAAPLASGDTLAERCWPTGNRIECEALQALTRARTTRAVRFLAWQRQHLRGAIEALSEESRADAGVTADKLAAIIGGYDAARVLLEGVTVGLIGPPNSGKSTLFNRLVGRAAAIVSPVEGTTRDWVAQSVDLEGIPVTLVDTAGRKVPADELENEANFAAQRVAEQADLCLFLVDDSTMVRAQDGAHWNDFQPLRRYLIVVTKSDLGKAGDDVPPIVDAMGRRLPFVRVSAKTGSGIDGLVREVFGLLGMAGRVDNIPCLFTCRQVDAAKRAMTALRSGGDGVDAALRGILLGA